jgi:galactokinase
MGDDPATRSDPTLTILIEAERGTEAAAALKELESKVDFQKLPADLQQSHASLRKVIKR